MEINESIVSSQENGKHQVVVVVVGNELYGILASNAINAEQNIVIEYPNFTKAVTRKDALLGATLYTRNQSCVPVYSLPRLLNKGRFIKELETMKETKNDHIKFYEKLVNICEHQISSLRGNQDKESDLDINSLQDDHTQCAFGKKLFGFLSKFDKHRYINDFLLRFVEPHKQFHGKVIEIKSNFDDADKIENILNEIKNKIYPELIRLFDEFNRELEKEINRNIYLFVKVGNEEQIVGLRVNKAFHLHEFNFEEADVMDGKKTHIALDKANVLGFNKGGEPAMIQFLDVDNLLGDSTSQIHN